MKRRSRKPSAERSEHGKTRNEWPQPFAIVRSVSLHGMSQAAPSFQSARAKAIGCDKSSQDRGK